MKMKMQTKQSDELVKKILEEKYKLEREGKRPRIILLSEKVHKELEEEWIESIQELPWGDSLVYELEQNKKQFDGMFLGDGSLFGLWIIKVDTIEEFKVY